MPSHPCFWCPWDCPSPEMAACGPEPAPDGEGLIPEPASSGEADCEPSWRQARGKVHLATDVIRDLDDYTALEPTAEAADGP